MGVCFSSDWFCSDCFRINPVQRQGSFGVDINSILQRNATLFQYSELRTATQNFHLDRKLGEGGFGSVFKGKLADGREIAVKKLSADSDQGRREFLNEIDLITNVQHRNLVKLIGCCVEGPERLLVYEYLPNNSLDKLLFVSNGRTELTWPIRRGIILGIARGLTYLHEELHVRIIHRDIKASNILLDSELNPKISDFGMARLFSNNDTHVSTSQVAGTLGYVAPEYAMRGELTEKADVFSFGLVSLEIVSGRKNTEDQQPPGREHLLEWAWQLFEEGNQVELVDSRLEGNFSAEEVIRVVHVALLCTQGSAELRPSMSRVIHLLSGRSQILDRPIVPSFIIQCGHSFFSKTSSNISTTKSKKRRKKKKKEEEPTPSEDSSSSSAPFSSSFSSSSLHTSISSGMSASSITPMSLIISTCDTSIIPIDETSPMTISAPVSLLMKPHDTCILSTNETSSM